MLSQPWQQSQQTGEHILTQAVHQMCSALDLLNERRSVVSPVCVEIRVPIYSQSPIILGSTTVHRLTELAIPKTFTLFNKPPCIRRSPWRLHEVQDRFPCGLPRFQTILSLVVSVASSAVGGRKSKVPFTKIELTSFSIAFVQRSFLLWRSSS